MRAFLFEILQAINVSKKLYFGPEINLITSVMDANCKIRTDISA